jgi:hypothetical protein
MQYRALIFGVIISIADKTMEAIYLITLINFNRIFYIASSLNGHHMSVSTILYQLAISVRIIILEDFEDILMLSFEEYLFTS